MKTLRARLVLPLCSPPIEDGAVRVEGERIAAVGRWEDLRADDAEDLGEVVLLPGLINAHCHLDYTVMRGAILRQPDFSGWVRRLNELKRTLSNEDYLGSIAEGLAELKRWGATGVFNIESFPELMVKMPQPPLRVWWFYEMLDIRNRIHTEDVVAGALTFFDRHPGWLGGFGLSPHAPYTTSARLYELVRFCCEKYSMPWMTHVAETEEEFEMFVKASGPLYEFLKKLGRNMGDTGGVTPLARLLSSGSIPHGGILTHMNCLSASDYDLLRSRAGDVHVVHCPRCHEYFGRPRFELEKFRKLNIPVSLGTDSLASNKALNMFEEMRQLRRTHPGVSAREALDMVTQHPARAIGLGESLGRIAPDALADLIAIPVSANGKDVYEAVVENRSEVSWMMVNGSEKPES